MSEEVRVKKDIEWFMEQMKSMTRIRDLDSEQESWYISEDALLEALKELDELEVLSQEWIQEKSVPIVFWTKEQDVILVKELQNLLVPKQVITEKQAWEKIEETYSEESLVKVQKERLEELGYIVFEKPTIPEFVVEFLIGKEEYMLFELLDEEWLYEEHDQIAKWLYDNDEYINREREADLALAHMYGYEVEEAQKFVVRDQHGVYLLAKNHMEQGNVQTVAEIVEYYGVEEIVLGYELTEQEIRDYDGRFWTFAKPVEE